MKKRILGSVVVLAMAALLSTRAGRACSYGGVTCNTPIGTACDGLCDGDVCQGTQLIESYCTAPHLRVARS